MKLHRELPYEVDRLDPGQGFRVWRVRRVWCWMRRHAALSAAEGSHFFPGGGGGGGGKVGGGKVGGTTPATLDVVLWLRASCI